MEVNFKGVGWGTRLRLSSVRCLSIYIFEGSGREDGAMAKGMNIDQNHSFKTVDAHCGRSSIYDEGLI